MGRREGGGSPHPPTHPALPVPGAPAPIFGAQGPRGIAGFPVSPVGYKEPCCACHTLRHSETPCEGSQKAWGGITPPPRGQIPSPTQPNCCGSCKTLFALRWAAKGGTRWWVTPMRWHRGMQGRKRRRGGQPPACGRLLPARSCKGQIPAQRTIFAPAEAGSALVPALESVTAGTKSVSPRRWRGQGAAGSAAGPPGHAGPPRQGIGEPQPPPPSLNPGFCFRGSKRMNPSKAEGVKASRSMLVLRSGRAGFQ